MRLIDADALKKALHNFFDGKVIDEPAYILRDVFCHIDNAPTVADRTEEVLSLQNTIAKLVRGIAENAPTVELTEEQAIDKLHETGWLIRHDKEMTERPKGEIVIKCKDCKYQVKEWREDKRMKDKGFWVYGCEHFGDIMGYWGFGGNDNEFCSDAEQKGGAE